MTVTLKDLIEEKRDKTHEESHLKANKVTALIEAAFSDDIEGRIDLLRKINLGQLNSFIERLNGVVRGIPRTRRGFDGERVLVGTETDAAYIPPKHEDKLIILNSAFKAAQQMEDVGKAAALLYYIIPFAHAAADGNGRMGRVLYYILRDMAGDPPGFSLEDALSSNGRNIYSKILKPLENLEYVTGLLVFRKLTPKDIFEKASKIYTLGNEAEVFNLNHSLSEQTSKRLASILGSSNLGGAALIMWAVENPQFNIKPELIEIDGRTLAKLEATNIWPLLDEEAAHNIIEKFYKFRFEQAQKIIDIFSNDSCSTMKDLADWCMNAGRHKAIN